jgi:hypothetical protein
MITSYSIGIHRGVPSDKNVLGLNLDRLIAVDTFPVNGLVATSDAIIERRQPPAQQRPVANRELIQ